MGITDTIEAGLQEEFRGELQPGEAVLRSGIATWRIKTFKNVNVNLFLTNQRLIGEDNLHTVEVVAAGGAIGGAIGTGTVPGSVAGSVGAGSALLSKDGGFALVLASVKSLVPYRPKLLGIPMADNTLDIVLQDGTVLTLVFGKSKRDVWQASIWQAVQASKQSTAAVQQPPQPTTQ